MWRSFYIKLALLILADIMVVILDLIYLVKH